jgi:circadian clock protein KaiB
MNTYKLRLYITGHTPQAERAIANLKRICEEDLGGRYEMDLIDLVEDPEAGEAQRIIATPTLVKQLPPPLRRIIGDLSDKERVLAGLDLIGPSASATTGDAEE